MTQHTDKRIGRGKAGPGRPSAKKEVGLKELMDVAWPQEERIDVIQHIVFLAMNAAQERARVNAAELLLAYTYGKPKAVDVSCPVDLNADVAKMTTEEREIYKLQLQQYLAKRGITT